MEINMDNFIDNHTGIFFVLVFLVSIFIFIVLCIAIGWPVTYLEYSAGIEAFRSTGETYRRARAGGNEIELAAIQVDIADANRWLASAKYYNGTIIGIFIPDEIDTLELIK